MTESPATPLLERLIQGDKSALAELFDRYGALVNGLALRVLRDVAEAEDVVQEVFLQVWRQAARYDARRGSPEAWLVTMARTRALDRLRRRTARREESAACTPARAQHPKNDEVLAVGQALDSLSADQRRAVELAYFSGLTQVEIADALGEPLGTIKTRIRTALMRLREAIDPS
jgi:RNA polymerase sigma-70 factor (ECF subfamily)